MALMRVSKVGVGSMPDPLVITVTAGAGGGSNVSIPLAGLANYKSCTATRTDGSANFSCGTSTMDATSPKSVNLNTLSDNFICSLSSAGGTVTYSFSTENV